MKTNLTLLLGLALVTGAAASPSYILRYTESPPLAAFLTQYQLELKATVAGRPIHSVRDPLNRDPAALIQQISDDTDDDVRIELDQIVRLPILDLPRRQTTGLAGLEELIRNQSRANLFGLPVPAALVRQPAIFQSFINTSWASHGGGAPVIVAVIDTGIDPNHPVFRGASVPGLDFVNPAGNGSEFQDLPPSALAQINPTTTPLLGVQVRHLSNGHAPVWRADRGVRLASSVPIGTGHGTMVAGAITLVSPFARILPIRAFSQNGTGRLFDVIRGLHAAEDRGAKVANLSLNTYTYSLELAQTIEDVSDRGLIVIASTGNDGTLNPLSYPARLEKVTGVASVNSQNQRSLFSNFGTEVTWVSAPGEALFLPFPGNRYAVGWGTSFAAPLVSGLAAKLLAKNPFATYSDVQSALGRSTPNSNVQLGLGTLNVFNSVEGM